MKTMTEFRTPSPAGRFRTWFGAETGGTMLATLGVLLSLGAPGMGAPALSAQQAATVGPEVVHATGAGWVGINVRVTESTGQPPEVRVTEVWPDSPAERAGLQAQDRILRVNGVDISPVQFKSLAQRLAPGDPMALTVDRGGQTVELTVIAEPRPRRVAVVPGRLQAELDSVRGRLSRILSSERLALVDSAGGPVLGRVSAPNIVVETMEGDSIRTRVVRADAPGVRYMIRVTGDSATVRTGVPPALRPDDPARLTTSEGDVVVRPLAPFLVGRNRVAGAELRPMNPGLASFFEADRGLLVTNVSEDTPAAEAGLTPGDVIVAANGAEVNTVEELRRRLERPRGGGARSLTVVRRGERLELILD